MSLVNTLILLIGVLLAFSEAQFRQRHKFNPIVRHSPSAGGTGYRFTFRDPQSPHQLDANVLYSPSAGLISGDARYTYEDSQSPHKFNANVRVSESGAVSGSVGWTFGRRRRYVESASPWENFKRLDKSGDSFVDVCEWTAEGGSLLNFMEFLRDDDTDGDERISFEEFPKLEPGDGDKGGNADGVETTTKA